MIDAREITLSLGGKWYRTYGAAPCPICQSGREKAQNALSIADGRNGGLVFDCKKSACAFSDLLAAAGITVGSYKSPDSETLAKREAEQRKEAEKHAAQAKAVWNEALPIAGTLAEAYLRGRGITCQLPKSLRFHPNCWHGLTAKRYPAMVAAVQGNQLAAVHRTYLKTDGSGKADIEPSKMMLGATKRAAVRLSESRKHLVVAEGIETALSLSSGLLSAPAGVWAALSTSGMRGLALPPVAGHLTIASDGEQAGREAANALAARANDLGWQVTLLPAPDGLDWNDVLMMKGETV